MSEREPSFLNDGPAGGRFAGTALGPTAGDPTRAARGGAPASTPPRSARNSAPTYLAAGFWRRLGGAAIDLALIMPVALLCTWLAGRLTGIALPPARYRSLDFWLDLLLASDPALFGAIGLCVAIGATYALVFQVTTGRTPGMRAIGVRVIDLYGDDPSVARALARTAGYAIALATLGLGFLWIGFDSEKRGLHDYLAGTYVVRA
jgi:uncharacterized RDD family membrane protein YckC